MVPVRVAVFFVGIYKPIPNFQTLATRMAARYWICALDQCIILSGRRHQEEKAKLRTERRLEWIEFVEIYTIFTKRVTAKVGQIVKNTFEIDWW